MVEKTAAINKWVFKFTSIFTISVENPTPRIPPELQRPWNEPTILRSKFFCMLMDCVFMAMLTILMQKEKIKTDATNMKIELEKPIAMRDKLKNKNATIIGILLSNFETSHPESGRPTSELMGSTSSRFPN